MMFGSMAYKQKPREEQAEVDTVDGEISKTVVASKTFQICYMQSILFSQSGGGFTYF